MTAYESLSASDAVHALDMAVRRLRGLAEAQVHPLDGFLLVSTMHSASNSLLMVISDSYQVFYVRANIMC